MADFIEVNGFKLPATSPADTANDIKTGKYPLRVLLYGKSGSGKSSMANTFPGRKGVIDTDNGRVVYTGDCKMYTIREDSNMSPDKPVAWKLAEAAMRDFIQDDSVKVIIIDSFTTLADACMKDVLASVQRLGQPPTFVEWSRQMDMLKEFLFLAFGSGKNVISLFHEEAEKDETTGQLWYLPLVTGKLAKKIPGYHDEVYHMEPEQKGQKIEYKARTKATRLYVAKSRLDTLINMPEVIPADMNQLIQRVRIANLDKRLQGTPVAQLSAV